MNKIAKVNPNVRFLIYCADESQEWPSNSKVYLDELEFIEALKRAYQDDFQYHVYIDEFNDFMDLPFVNGNGNNLPTELRLITRKGRHYGITAWIGAQRPFMIPPVIRNCFQRRFCFSLMGNQDRKLVVNESPVEDQKEFTKSLLKLEKLEYVVITNNDISYGKIGK